jgi:hypothetical protein
MAYYAIRNVNNYLVNNYLTNFNFFVKAVYAPCIEPKCGVMRWEELWGFQGKLITTNIESTRRVMKLPATFDHYYYVYDLDWLRIGTKPWRFEELSEFYQNPSIKLLTRTKRNAELIKNIWGTSAGVVEDFNINQLLTNIEVD